MSPQVIDTLPRIPIQPAGSSPRLSVGNSLRTREFLVGILVGGLRIKRQMPCRVQIQLAVRQKPGWATAHVLLRPGMGAVHLRPIPPMGDDVAKGGRPSLVLRTALIIGACAPDRHFRLRPIVALWDREAQRRINRIVDAMAQPVMHHELQPGAQQDIYGRCRHEIAARKQLAANDPRVGVIKVGRILAEGLAIGVTGGALGCGLAYLGFNLLPHVAAALGPLAYALILSRRIVAYSFMIAALIGGASAFIPATLATRHAISEELRAV